MRLNRPLCWLSLLSCGSSGREHFWRFLIENGEQRKVITSFFPLETSISRPVGAGGLPPRLC